MLEPTLTLEQFTQDLTQAGFDPARAKVRRGTIVEDSERRAHLPDDALDTLPTVATQQACPGPQELAIGAMLGQGGMGMVLRAHQLPLEREVAVKMMRADGSGSGGPSAIVQEARITGALEHPNIVPIHTLGRTTTGEPLFVMKRIAGVSWKQLLEDEYPERDLAAGEDRSLARHLGIFESVCNALSFAHSKNIIHRDLKPENVMVGDYGEVYVLDWGLALACDETSRKAWPDGFSVAGTPAYMAPEMVAGNLAALGLHTDIYLLGALLHRLVMGKSRHRGRNLPEVLYAAHTSAPVTYPAWVPRELAAICTRATERSPQRRYGSVAELHVAVSAYLTHRGSHELVREANVRLHQLADAQRAAAESQSTNDDAIVHRLFAECRFGFKQAQRIWADNEEAEAGLAQALASMATYEIERGSLAAARRHLADMVTPPADLCARLAEREQQARLAQEHLQSLQLLEHDSDLCVAQRERARFMTVLATLWFLGYGAIACLEWLTTAEPRYGWGFVGAFPSLAYVVGYMRSRRHTILRNEANRRLTRSMLFCFAAVGVSIVAGRLAQVSFLATHGNLLLVLFAVCGVVAICLDQRIWPTVIPSGLGYLIVRFLGGRGLGSELWCIAFAGAMTFYLFAWVWRERAIDQGPLLADASVERAGE